MGPDSGSATLLVALGAGVALVVNYECRAIDETVVSQDVFSGVVLMSLATCIVAPVALRRMLSRAPGKGKGPYRPRR